MVVIAWALRHWRDLALAGALAAVALTSRCAAERAREAAEWKADYQAATAGKVAALRELAQARAATDRMSESLDSAVSWWSSYVAGLESAAPRISPITPPATSEPPDTAGTSDPRVAELVRRGNELLRACTAYRSSCKEERARSSAAIDSLKRVITVLEHRPSAGPERAPLLSPRVGGGWDPVARAAAVGAGADVRLWGRWQLSAEVVQPLARGEEARAFVGLWRRF